MADTEQLPYIRVSHKVSVVGQNDEMADIVNPQGLIYADDYYLEAIVGEWSLQRNTLKCYAHFHSFTSKEEAEKFCNHVLKSLKDSTRRLDPENNSSWSFSRIPYGSDGWDEQELAHEIEEAERNNERHPMA